MLTAFCLSLVVNRASILSSACTYSRLRYLSYRYFLLGMNHPITLFSESQNCIANSQIDERVIPCKLTAFILNSISVCRELSTNRFLIFVAFIVHVFFSQERITKEENNNVWLENSVLRENYSIVRYLQYISKFIVLYFSD